MLFEFEGVEGTAEAGFEVAQQGIDPTELGQVVWVLSPGDNCLVVTVGRGHGAEISQAIAENMAARREVPFGPVRDRF